MSGTRIYEIIAAGHLMDASLLNFKTVAEYFEPDVLQMAHEYLEHIKDIFGINLSEDEDFYITLLQYIRCLKIPGHIFNDQENPDLIRSNLLIEYELACLFQPLALKYLGSYPEPHRALIPCPLPFGAIEFLSTQHPEQKLKTVICSHLTCLPPGPEAESPGGLRQLPWKSPPCCRSMRKVPFRLRTRTLC